MSAATDFSTHADPLDTAAPAPSGLSASGWARWAWRRLISMRTALILLLLLAFAAIPGSLLPQRTSDALAVNAYFDNNPGLAQFWDRIGLFDVYGAVWFSAIYLLLFISLVGCVTPRIRLHWRAWRAGPPAPPRKLSRLDATEGMHTDDPAESLDLSYAELRKRRWRVRRGDGWIAAEKGFIRETGNEVFHLALVFVLLAIGLGSLAGWHGNVVVREGHGFSNTVAQYDTFTAGRFADLGDAAAFSLTLDDFDVDFERSQNQRGAPRDFTAAVTTSGPGLESTSSEFGVNEPLVIDEAKVFLLGHGYAPHVIVRDESGQVVFDDTAVFLPQDAMFRSAGVVKVPDTSPQLGLRGLFLPTAALTEESGPISTFPAPDDPALYLSAFTGDLGLDTGEPQSVYTLDDENLQQIGLRGLRPGETWELPEGAGSVEFAGFDRWISVKVAHDPGGAWALLAIGVAVLGMTASLFVRRRRLWVVAGADSVTVAGVARGEGGDAADDVSRLSKSLGASVSDRPTT